MASETDYQEAFGIACIWHWGQMDLTGEPYYRHLMAVADNDYVNGDDELRVAALLHDILEDTECSERNLRDYHLSDRVIQVVKILTKNENESYEAYINRVIEFGGLDAIRIKIADVMDHLSNHSVDVLTPAMLERYNRALHDLKIAYTGML